MVTFAILFDKHIKLVANKQESSVNIIRALLRVVHCLNSSPELQESMPVSFKDFRDSKVLTNNDSRALFEKIISSSATNLWTRAISKNCYKITALFRLYS